MQYHLIQYPSRPSYYSHLIILITFGSKLPTHSAAQEVGEVWAGRYFWGPKVLDSKIIVYLRNFGEKIIALTKFML